MAERATFLFATVLHKRRFSMGGKTRNRFFEILFTGVSTRFGLHLCPPNEDFGKSYAEGKYKWEEGESLGFAT